MKTPDLSIEDLVMCDYIKKLWLLIDVQDKVREDLKKNIEWWQQECDDVRENCDRFVKWTTAENERLRKEADWLAAQITLCPYAGDCEFEDSCESNCARTVDYWRDLARKSTGETK